jgi:hypothetical protein
MQRIAACSRQDIVDPLRNGLHSRSTRTPAPLVPRGKPTCGAHDPRDRSASRAAETAECRQGDNANADDMRVDERE